MILLRTVTMEIFSSSRHFKYLSNLSQHWGCSAGPGPVWGSFGPVDWKVLWWHFLETYRSNAFLCVCL